MVAKSEFNFREIFWWLAENHPTAVMQAIKATNRIPEAEQPGKYEVYITCHPNRGINKLSFIKWLRTYSISQLGLKEAKDISDVIADGDPTNICIQCEHVASVFAELCLITPSVITSLCKVG
jgi:hypothetical protein